ncbi:unnamed protein product [Arctogadus glacialis]
MAFMVKSMVGGQLKTLTGGLTEEKAEGGEKTEAAAQGMTQEEFEQYQQQLEEEKPSWSTALESVDPPWTLPLCEGLSNPETTQRPRPLQPSSSGPGVTAARTALQEREANFAQKKAERATVRSHFRDKYRLPKNELDETQIQQAGDDVELPTELAKMIAQDNQEEESKTSVLGQLTSIQNVDMDQLKDKAQATLEDLKKQTENCSLM